MDKHINYHQIILDELRKRATYKILNAEKKRYHLVADQLGGSYILLSIGWVNDNYQDDIVFHLEIKDGKVWVHQDNTDVGIAEVLAEQGIPKSDIVLAFLPHYAQELSEYAVAS